MRIISCIYSFPIVYIDTDTAGRVGVGTGNAQKQNSVWQNSVPAPFVCTQMSLQDLAMKLSWLLRDAADKIINYIKALKLESSFPFNVVNISLTFLLYLRKKNTIHYKATLNSPGSSHPATHGRMTLQYVHMCGNLATKMPSALFVHLFFKKSTCKSNVIRCYSFYERGEIILNTDTQ